MKRTEIKKNYKGLWMTEVYENDRLIVKLEYTTKKGLLNKLKEMELK